MEEALLGSVEEALKVYESIMNAIYQYTVNMIFEEAYQKIFGIIITAFIGLICLNLYFNFNSWLKGIVKRY